MNRCRRVETYSGDVKTGGGVGLRDESEGYLLTARAASGMEAARTRSGLLRGTWEPVVPMARETRKRQNRERLSTDAAHRGGVVSSSEEGPVMGLERRGHLNRHGGRGQPEREDPGLAYNPQFAQAGGGHRLRRAGCVETRTSGSVSAWG